MFPGVTAGEVQKVATYDLDVVSVTRCYPSRPGIPAPEALRTQGEEFFTSFRWVHKQIC